MYLKDVVNRFIWI